MISSYKKGSYLEVSEHSLSVAIHSKSSAKIIFLMWLIWKRKSNETDPWDASLTWRDHLLSHKSLLQSMVMSTLINFDSDFYVEKKNLFLFLGTVTIFAVGNYVKRNPDSANLLLKSHSFQTRIVQILKFHSWAWQNQGKQFYARSMSPI